MKYSGLPFWLWKFYQKSFTKNLVLVLDVNKKDAKNITKKALLDYKEIIAKLPTFDSRDRFGMNIVNCAMVIAFLKYLEQKPTVEKLTTYYDQVMRTKLTKIFCRIKGKARYKEKTIEGLINESKYRFANHNEYSWNFEVYRYEDGNGFECLFTKCGICKLMKEYGFGELTPAMCHMDYTLNEMCGNSIFIRKQTLAEGAPYCDNGYKKKN